MGADAEAAAPLVEDQRSDDDGHDLGKSGNKSQVTFFAAFQVAHLHTNIRVQLPDGTVRIFS